jgi:hypothetical protein
VFEGVADQVGQDLVDRFLSRGMGGKSVPLTTVLKCMFLAFGQGHHARLNAAKMSVMTAGLFPRAIFPLQCSRCP